MPTSHPRLMTVFTDALECADPRDQADYLDRACESDVELRYQVEQLLAAHRGAGRFLTPEAAAATQTCSPATKADDTEPAGVVGQTIAGRYTLVEPIGEGGMGSVWLAKQTEPVKRTVALKVVKAGMDSRQVLARFEAERQALAVMDHPNIAKVLDGGLTPDGRPFFAMELVKGVPITEFCDARRLTPKERLELFVPVCQAIQHAHQKGIVHRDIKPSNVLVALYDDRPVPKVIDFGVAKATGVALTEQTIHTGFGGVVGTPQYMSPEQATFNNLDIDTRSDVYSLGVLLYELLTGSPPFARKDLERKGLLEILRVVREEEPPRPSTRLSTAEGLPTLSANRGTEPKKLTGLLRNELDWIVMKALEKDRARRYETATGFAADVQRYLAGEAVLAHPPSAGYRLKKAYRKNRAAVRVACAFLGLMIAAVVMGTVLAVRATNAELVAAGDRDAAIEARKDADERSSAVNTAYAQLQKEEEKTKAGQDRLRRLLYVSQMNHAAAALNAKRIPRLLQLLEETTPKPGEPDVRGWEWHYLDRLTHAPVLREFPEVVELKVEGRVGMSTLTSDGRKKLEALYSDDGVAFRLTETETGRQLGRVPSAGWLKAPHQIPQRRNMADEIAVSPDGRFCARVWTDPPADGKAAGRRIRIWRFDTGEEVPGPTDPFPIRRFYSTLELGPDASWVVWEDTAEPKRQRTKPGDDPQEYPATFARWNRKEGETTRKSFKLTGSSAWTIFLRGSESAICFAQIPSDRTAIEGWDLNADPVVRKYSILLPKSASSFGEAHLEFSPNTSVVAIWDLKEVTVYRLSDGVLLWRVPFVRVSQSGPEWLAGVSDDGTRVLYSEANHFTVIEKAGDAVDSPARHLNFPHRHVVDTTSHGFTGEPKFSSDGKNILMFDRRVLPVASRDNSFHPTRVLDVSRDPRVRGSNPRGLWIEPLAAEKLRRNQWDLPWILRDPAGKEAGRIEPGPDERIEARLVADARRVLVTISSRQNPRPTNTWALYELGEADGRPKRIAGGDGRVGKDVPESTRFLVRRGLTVSLASQGVDVHDAITGRQVWSVDAPAGSSFFYEPLATADWFVVLSAPSNTIRSPAALNEKNQEQPQRQTLWMYEAATGREIWHADIDLFPRSVAAFGLPPMTPSPDRKQILITYQEKDQFIVRIHRAADGAVERTLKLPIVPTDSDGGLRPVARLVGFSPSGQLATTARDKVHLIHPETGRIMSRLRGHVGDVFRVEFSPDGTRLFALEGDQGKNGERIRIWDLTTERELLVVPTPYPMPAEAFRLVDGKFQLSSPEGLYILDGTPRK